MKLTDICIRRPVLSTVMSLIIVLIGIVSYDRLQLRQYPNVDQPKISIFTQLEGAGPEIIETQVTKILENAFAGIEGLELMTSRSEIGESRINLTFKLDRNIDDAANDVRDKIGRIKNKLPNDITDPRIKKQDADAAPFIYLALSSDRHDVKDIADFASRHLESRLESIGGVSSIDVFGGGEYEMKLILDPVKLAGYNITSEDIASALKRQNLEKPAGNLVSNDQEIIVTTKARLLTEADFNRLIIGQKDGYLIRLSDVGGAELNAIDRRNRVLFNGENAVAIGITKQSTGDLLSIAADIRKEMDEFRLPAGMKIDVAKDSTIFVSRSIDEVYETIYIAIILVVLVIFFFLRSPRAIFIPVVTIPLSLIGAFAIMYALGFTINILTLLALVLAIGLVVDDAIVMLENIYRYIEQGQSPLQAAFKGAKEISFAVIAMTVTLAAVYAPIALSPGMTGKLFTEFAITLAGSVLLSGFVALTLTPMMCGRLLKPHHQEKTPSSFFKKLDLSIARFLDKLDNSYEKILSLFLTYRVWTLASGLLVAVAGYFIFTALPTELLPREDQGIVNARAIPPFGANIEYVERHMEKVDQLIEEVDEVTTRLTMISAPGESLSLNALKPWEERKRSSQDIVNSLRDPLEDITGLRVYPSSGGKALLGSSSSEEQIQLVVTSGKSQKELEALAVKIHRLVAKTPGVYNALRDIGSEGQEYVVTIDRDKAASLGVEVSTIAESLDTLISGRPASKFKKDNKIYNVKVEIDERFRKSPDDITGLFVRGTKDRRETLVPLSEVVTIEKKMTPTEIQHYSGMRSIMIRGKLKPGISMSDTLTYIRDESRKVLPVDADILFTGESKRYLDESATVYVIFGLALAFIFLVLAAQYESWRDPWIIMLSVPLSIAGAIVTLKLFGQTMNLYSQIGLVTLIGLITKHGILIVDFANQRKVEGASRVQAVIEASKLRLRPILMTTLAMVIGAVPLAFADGAGSESRQPIGLTIVGGMTLGTIFTLFIVPAVYTFLSSKEHVPLVESPYDDKT